MSSLKKLLKAHSGESTSDLLVSPRFEQYLATHPNTLVDDTVAEFIKSELTTPQRNRRMTFSASSRGACAREQVFQFTSLRQVPKTNTSLYAIFHQGTFMHLKWQALLLDAGILNEVEMPCRWDEFNVTGTIDGGGEVTAGHPLRADHDSFGWELKSINSRGFRWVIDTGPKFQHLLQIHTYMLATGKRLWSLVYENKDTQEWKEFVVHFDEEVAQKVREELAYLNDHVAQKRLPPILPDCIERKGPFKNCGYAYACLEQDSWPGDEQPKPLNRRIKVG